MTRFLLLAHGTRGDVDPFVALAGALVRRRRDVTVLTHAPYEETVAATGADFRAVDDAAGYARHLRRARDLLGGRHHTRAADYYGDADLFLDRVSVAGGFGQIRREVEAMAGAGDDTVVVGRLTSCLSGLMAAELTGSPVCQVSLSPFQSMTAPMTALHLARSAGTQLNALRAGLGLPPVTGWSRWLRRADLTVGLWPGWFDAAGPASPGPLMLTGFPLGDRAAGGSRLGPVPDAGREDVVVVTGGTGRMLHPGFYASAVAGLAAAGRRGIVVTPHADLVPRVLPPGVVHRTSMPFAEVLPRVAGVVHHGGMGTLARALASGTPQLLLAHGADRPDNGARLERLGLARSLGASDWSAGTVGREIARLGPAGDPGLLNGPDPMDMLADRVVALAGRARAKSAERWAVR